MFGKLPHTSVKSPRSPLLLSLLSGLLFASAASVFATTTIGANISTGGTLTVTSTSATSTFSTGGLTIGTSQFVVQQTSGNVGVGTTTPSATFAVQGAGGGSSTFSFRATNSSGAPILTVGDGERISINGAPMNRMLNIAGTANNYGILEFTNPGTGTSQFSGMQIGWTDISTPNFDLWNYENGFVRIATNNSERMRITSSGSLGIGTTSPYAQLSVNPNGISGPSFVIGSSTATKFIVTNGGNVGIGTADPITQLNIPGIMPTQVSIVGSISSLNGNPAALYVQDGVAWVGSWSNSNRLQAFDVSDPAHPVLLSAVNPGGSPWAMKIQGNLLYLGCDGGCGYGVKIYNISNPSAPIELGSSGGGMRSRSIAVQGKYVYTEHLNANTFNIFDVSNPSSPIQVGSLSVGSQPNGLVVKDNYVYLAVASTLDVIDVSNPASPRLVTTVSGAGGADADSIDVQDHFLYIVAGGNLNIYDISNPTNPTQVGHVTASIDKMFIQGRYLYSVPFSTSGIVQVFDIASSTNPTLVGNITVPSQYTSAVFVRGRYMYLIGNGDTTLYILDLGGTYLQQLETGGILTGTLTTRQGITAGGNVDIRGGLSLSKSLSAFDSSAIFASSSQSALKATQFFSGDLLNLYSSSTKSVVVSSLGLVGLSTTSPWRTLSVSGTLGLSSTLSSATTGNYLCINTSTYEVTSGTTCSASSERFKDNIKPLTYGLSTILKLSPVSFTYKKDINPNDQSTKLGFIAEQVDPLIPELVAHDKDNKPESVDYAKLAPVLTKAIQELNTKVDLLSLSTGTQPLSPSSFFLSLVINPLKELGIRVEEGVVRAQEFVAETITARKVVTDAIVTNAFEIKDAATDDRYCVRLAHGAWLTQPGECGTNADSGSSATQSTLGPAPVENLERDVEQLKA